MKTSLCCTIALVLLSVRANAGTFAIHTGANDPTTEGWTFVTGGAFNIGPTVNDQGHNAWITDDNGNFAGSGGGYIRF